MNESYEALRNRDAAAWEQFYQEHGADVYGFVVRLLAGKREAAADVFQETWLDAIDHIGQFDPERGELRAWLFGIARRGVALHWRRATQQRNAIAGAGGGDPLVQMEGAVVPDEVMERLERAAVVRASLLALAPARREALLQKYVEKLSVAQIADRSGSTPKAVESLLSRAREEMRTLLRRYFSDTHCR